MNIQNWNKAAAVYCSRQDELVAIYKPVVEQLMGNVSGKHVLDAGCGDGTYSRKLVSWGAIVIGIDGSTEMISIAESLPMQPNLKYRVLDLTEKLPFSDASFDVVLANMVIMDIPRIDVAIPEFSRLLTEEGILVFSITHPCFFSSDWDTDANGEKLFKRISDYLTPKVEELNFWGKTLHYHRPLSHYFDVLSQSGFCVDRFKEPTPTDEMIEKYPSWEYHRRLPSYVVIRAIKK